MSKRYEAILNHEFFVDKKDIANQIVEFEKDGKGYLSNNFDYKIIPPEALGNLPVPMTIGRIDKFYYLGIQKDGEHWSYQVFENSQSLKRFFSDKDILDESEVASWFNQIERLA